MANSRNLTALLAAGDIPFMVFAGRQGIAEPAAAWDHVVTKAIAVRCIDCGHWFTPDQMTAEQDICRNCERIAK